MPDPTTLAGWSEEKKKAMEKDVALRKKFETRIASWLSEHVIYTLRNHRHYGSVDLAWDSTPINKHILPLMLYAQGRVDIAACAKALADVPNGNKYVHKNDSGQATHIDLPKFSEVEFNLIRSVITRRVAAQSNKYNGLWPFFKYESRKQTQVSKLRADLLSQRMDIMADQYDYRHFQDQVIRDMFLYGHSVAFPRASWERDVQWEKVPVAPELATKKPIEKRARIEREGVAWINPHPSRVFWDNAFALSSINCDMGCEYVGFWDLCRWRDIAENPHYFNRDSVSFSADTAAWFTQFSTYFNQYFDRITPPTMPGNADAPNDRLNNVGLYTGEMEDTAAIHANIFVKITPKEWGIGEYPYPIWVQLKTAGDSTVVYADIMPSGPGANFSFNENDGRLLNSSMAHELMGYQDQITNLLGLFLEVVKADLFAIGVLNTDIFPDDDKGRAALQHFRAAMQGQNWYGAMQILEASFEKLREVGIATDEKNIFKIVRSAPNTALTAIIEAIARVIQMAEKLMVLSANEQGQAASHEISATESNQISTSTETVYTFISSAIDRGRAAMKKICYESFIAKGAEDLELSVLSRYPPKVVEMAGFAVLAEDAEDESGMPMDPKGNTAGAIHRTLRGSKMMLRHDYIFTTRDGGERSANTQSANVLVQLIQALGTLPEPITRALFGAMGKEKVFQIFNEIFRKADTGVDMALELKPGESDELLIEEDQQVMQMFQRLGEAVQQNTEDVAEIRAAMGVDNGAAAPTRNGRA